MVETSKAVAVESHE